MAFWQFLIVIGLLAIIVIGPIYFSILEIFRIRFKLIDYLKSRPTTEDFERIMEKIYRPMDGIKGLNRLLIALSVILILGISLLFIVFMLSTSDDNIEIIKNSLSGLVAIVGTIAGFYFGNRAAEAGQPQADASSSAPTNTTSPIVSSSEESNT